MTSRDHGVAIGRSGFPHPNRIVLAYCVLMGVSLIATAGLATLVLAVSVTGRLSGPPASLLSNLLIWTTLVTMGVLPWPALASVLWAMWRPRPRGSFAVETRPAGPTVVVLTALNEEAAIAPAVRDFLDAPNVALVIVVDNGSTDRTRELASDAGARVVVEERPGYGNACIRGLREGLRSGLPVVALVEGDRTFRALDLGKLTTYLQHADLVIGSRTHESLINDDSQLSSFLLLGNRFVAKFLELRYWSCQRGARLRLTDVGCTYRAIRAEALQRILPSLEVGGNHFSPHMIMVALECGLTVLEVPVTFWKRLGTSKGGNASVRAGVALGLTMLWHILTYRVRAPAEIKGASPGFNPVVSSGMDS